jgi:hypothetical protein
MKNAGITGARRTFHRRRERKSNSTNEKQILFSPQPEQV